LQKPKKDSYKTAATLLRAKKSLKKEKAETNTIRELNYITRAVNRDSDLDNSS
jgi:hypothetical protein